MSVLIKGMEMPKNCMLCSFCVEEADPANGEMCLVTGKLMPPCNHERLDDCTLIEIPPHGRLIDADLFSKVLKGRAAEEWNQHTVPFSWSYAYECLIDTVGLIPTVIPADKDGEA